MKRVLLYGGLVALGYHAFRVWRLAGAHVTNDPASSTISLTDAIKSQGVPWIAVGALVASRFVR